MPTILYNYRFRFRSKVNISHTAAPKVFTLAYALIKPFLHEVTLKKIKIFGHSGWKEALLQDISPDQLPQHWGGSRTDPDGNPKCPSQVGDFQV